MKKQVRELILALANGPKTAAELRDSLLIVHRKFFRDNYINPAIRAGVFMPEEGLSPHNPHLRYFITAKGVGYVTAKLGDCDNCWAAAFEKVTTLVKIANRPANLHPRRLRFAYSAGWPAFRAGGKAAPQARLRHGGE